MKESRHGSLLPLQESLFKRSVRFLAKKVVPVSLTAAATSLMIAACGGEETKGNENQSFSNPQNLPVPAALNLPSSEETTENSFFKEKISFEKNPLKLYKALFVNPHPIPDSMLPENVTFKRTYPDGWAGEPMYNAVGRVHFVVENKNRHFRGGGITYTIFSKNSDARAAYETIINPSNNKPGLIIDLSKNNNAREIKGFAYHATVFRKADYADSYPTNVLAMPVENVLVTTKYVQDPDQYNPVNPEKELIDLANTALQYLKKFGK